MFFLCIFCLLQQAQRRALEEQHAANPPVKASPGIAVSVPPAANPKKAAKTAAPAPQKIPEAAVPAAAPVVESPEVVLQPVVTEPISETVPLDVKAPEEPDAAVALEQTPAEVEVEVQVPVTEEAPTVETSAPETVQEAEPVIPETEPDTEVRTKEPGHDGSLIALLVDLSRAIRCVQSWQRLCQF